MVKSPDAFRTISEVSEWLDRPTHVLRFWESKFPQIKPVKRAGGRRYYRPQDMLLLGGIKRLLHDDGMTIKGVQKMLREQGVAHVSAMSQPLEDDLAAALVAEQAETAQPDREAPMTVMAEDTQAHTGARVLPFPDPAVRKTEPREAEGSNAATDPEPLAPATPVTAAQNLLEDQPSLPFDLPVAPVAGPSARGDRSKPLPAPLPAPSSAPSSAPVPAPVAAPEQDTDTAPETAAVPAGLLSRVARIDRPLPPDRRAALLPLVRRLVRVAERMRVPQTPSE